MEEILAIIEGMTGEDGKIDAAELAGRIGPAAERLEKQAQESAERCRAERKQLALAELLVRNGAKDVDYLLYRLAERAKFGEDGTLLDGEALLADAKEEFPAFFARRRGRISGVRPGEGASGPVLGAEEFERMSYRERLRLFEDDPELYRSLRGEAQWE